MVEEILVKEQLTKEMIDVGASLVDELSQAGLPINLAMWFFTPEANKWRLLIASPLRATAGSREIYRRVREAEKRLGPEAAEILRWAVGTVSTDDELVQALMDDPYLPRDGKPVRLTRSGVRGRFIDDALVYRRSAKP